MNQCKIFNPGDNLICYQSVYDVTMAIKQTIAVKNFVTLLSRVIICYCKR